MTKADIVNEISKSTGVEKAAVLETVEKFMEVVKDSLANGENVYLRGFGSFIVKVRSENCKKHFQEYDNHHSGAQNPGFQTGKSVYGRG